MRFKSIFWLFNIVVVIALIIFAGASFFLFGKDYAAVYWGNMWFVAVLFLLFIGVLDFYFIRNWSLFELLEAEDWPALLAWLENRLYTRGQIRRPYANLLINTALSVANYDAVKKLDAEIRQRKPELMRHLGVSLGIPHIKEENRNAILDHYNPLADDPKTHRRDWARWCRAMASGEDGIEEMTELLSGKDPSIRLLACYILDGYRPELEEAGNAALELARSTLKADLAGEAGNKALQRSREDHLLAAVLAARVNEARTRLP